MSSLGETRPAPARQHRVAIGVNRAVRRETAAKEQTTSTAHDTDSSSQESCA